MPSDRVLIVTINAAAEAVTHTLYEYTRSSPAYDGSNPFPLLDVVIQPGRPRRHSLTAARC